MPKHVVRAARRHAGLGELLGEDHLLERRQPGAAVLVRPAGREVAGSCSVVAPLRRRTSSTSSPVERADAAASRPAAARRGTPGPSRGTPRPRRRTWGPSTADGTDGCVRPPMPGRPAGTAASGPRPRRRRAAPRAERRDRRPTRCSRDRAARTWARRLRWSSSGWAASKNGAPKPPAPSRRARRGGGRTRRRPTRRPARPSCPVRSMTDAGARRSGRFGLGLDRRRRRLGRRGSPVPPHDARQPVGLDDDVAEWPALPAARRAAGRRRRCRRRRRRHEQRHEVVDAPRRADQPSPSASALASLSTEHGRQPGQLGEPLAQREVPPGRDVQRRHRPAAASIGPPQPTPQRSSAPASSGRPRRRGAPAACSAGHTSRGGVATRSRTTHLAVARRPRRRPARSLPTSIARYGRHRRGPYRPPRRRESARAPANVYAAAA